MAFNEYFNAAMAPAQNYLSGQESGMRNHLMMQQMQQAQAQAEQQAAAQEQQGLYQNLLAEYLGPEVAGQARPPEQQAQILNQLFAMNPQATNELVQFQGGQQEQQTAQSRAQAERAYLQAQHVKASRNPVAALRLIPAMGETNPVRALMEAYGLESEEEITDDMARAMADRVIEMVGPEAGFGPAAQEGPEVLGKDDIHNGQVVTRDAYGNLVANSIPGFQMDNSATELDQLRLQRERLGIQTAEQELEAGRQAEARRAAEEQAAADQEVRATESLLAQTADVADYIRKAYELVPTAQTGHTGSLLAAASPSGENASLRRSLQTVKSNIGFDKLMEMKRNSPTGGALGAVSERELSDLQATLGSLDPRAPEAEIRDVLTKVYSVYDRINRGSGGQGLTPISQSMESGRGRVGRFQVEVQ